MVKKKNAEQDVGLVQMFNEMKKKHPDAMLLFRNGNFYEMYKEDALKASVILALKVSDKILPLEKDPIKLLIFPHHELDIHLPKLVRSGERVAICDAIDHPVLMKKPKEKTGEDLKEPQGFKVIQGDMKEWERQQKLRYDEQHPEYLGLVMTDKNRWEYQQVVDKQSQERALKLSNQKEKHSQGLKL